MKIRTRLTLQFVSIVATIVTISLISIYYFSSEYKKKEFYTRLRNKAITTGKLLVQVKEVGEDLLKVIDNQELTALAEKDIKVYDSNEHLIYDYNPAKAGAVKVDSELLKSIKEKEEVRFFSGNYQVVGLTFSYERKTYVIITSAFDRLGYNNLNNLKIILYIVFFLSILFVTIAGWIFSGKAMEPISEVIKEVDAISVSNLNARVKEGNGKDEIAQLAKTFNRMLERIETAFKLQKVFVANASHELRTPLTSITGQLEVTLLKKRNTEEYESTMRSVLDDIKRLTDLSNRLLSLAKVNSGFTEIGFLNLRVDEMLWQSRTELLKSNPSYSIKIEFKKDIEEEEKLKILGNDKLMQIAFQNIIENGCKFSSDKSILIQLDFDKNFIVLNFIDNGVGIAPEDQKNIFEPFYRGTNAIQIKGYGVGLSLVDKIVKLHKGSVQVQSELNKGTIFTLKFPALT